MFRIKKIAFLLFLIIVTTSVYSENNQIINISRDVRLKPLAENVWIHITDIRMPEWGRVSANGMAIITDSQLVLVDTPWNVAQTGLLVEWFRNHYDFSRVKVIVCHYHDDNLGGLNWINQNGYESYSIKKTHEICIAKKLPVPGNTIPDTFRFDFNDIPIETFFPGEGHTVDSICVYLPNERILFGGCSVKALNNTTLGNTEDADLDKWPASLRAMKKRFPDAEIVIPGHGAVGDILLIDHTLSLF